MKIHMIVYILWSKFIASVTSCRQKKVTFAKNGEEQATTKPF